MTTPGELYAALDRSHPNLSAELTDARSTLPALTSKRHPLLTAWSHSPTLLSLSHAADNCYRTHVDCHTDLILVDPDLDYHSALSPWPDGEAAITLYCDVYMAAAFTHYAPSEPVSSTDPLRATYATLFDLVADYAALAPLALV